MCLIILLKNYIYSILYNKEDKQNEEGGRWAVTLTRMGSKIDEYWMNLVNIFIIIYFK